MKYYISGKVLPERANVQINQFVHEIPAIGKIIFKCDASQIGIILETEKDEQTAIIFAKDFAATVVSALGFTLGNGYDTEITQVLTELGIINVYGVSITELKLEDKPHLFQHFAIGVFGDVFLRYAIRDYLRAFTEELDCAFLCYKSIETIKSSFEFRNPVGNPWERMNESLGTNAEDIKTIVKPVADALRHGGYHNPVIITSSTDRLKMLSLNRDVIEKYFNYLKTEKLIPEALFAV